MTLTQLSFQGYVLQELKLKVIPEHKFHPSRKWKFDYAIPSHNIAIEVEGGAFKERTYTNKNGKEITTIGGRHNSGTGFINDMEKYNAGTALGWRILRVTPDNLLKQNTLDLISQTINNLNK